MRRFHLSERILRTRLQASQGLLLEVKLAASIADEFLAVIDGEQERNVLHEVVTLFRDEIRELLIEIDVVPTIKELRGSAGPDED